MHSTILGDDSQFYSFDVCKGAWVILLNGFLRGGSFASKELIEIMVKWINGTSKEDLKVEYGTSPGMADAIPLMQMAYQILDENNYKPKHGEGLALLSSNAFSMCEAAFSIFQLKKLIKMAELGIALALLAEDGNCSIVQDLGIKAARHWDVKVETIKAVQDYWISQSSRTNNIKKRTLVDGLHSYNGRAKLPVCVYISNVVRWNFRNIHSRNLGLSCRNGMHRTNTS